MDRGEVTLTLIGGPTVLIELDGLRMLTDPTFDPPGHYPGPAHLEKTAGPAIASDDVGAFDAVLLSHDQHFDNLDRAGRAFRERARTTFTTRVAEARLAGGSKGLAPFETAVLEGGRLQAIHNGDACPAWPGWNRADFRRRRRLPHRAPDRGRRRLRYGRYRMVRRDRRSRPAISAQTRHRLRRIGGAAWTVRRDDGQ